MATFKPARRVTAIAGSAALLAGLGIAGAAETVHAVASSPAVKTGNATSSCRLGDSLFTSINARLTSLDKERDALAIKIKDELYAAEN